MGEQAFVPQVDEAPGADLKGKVGALEAVSLDGDLEVVVSLWETSRKMRFRFASFYQK